MTVQQAATYLGLSIQRVYQLIHSVMPEKKKMCGVYLLSEREVLRLGRASRRWTISQAQEAKED